MAIQGFKDEVTAAVFRGERPKGFQSDIFTVTRRKLAYLHAAAALSDMMAPPGNRLEALKGDRVGQHSIRVNDQYRLCFIWTEAGPAEVEFTDYH